MDFSRLSRSELEYLLDQVRAELDSRPKECAHCGRGFYARAQARTCSGRCRVALHRNKSKRLKTVGK